MLVRVARLPDPGRRHGARERAVPRGPHRGGRREGHRGRSPRPHDLCLVRRGQRLPAAEPRLRRELHGRHGRRGPILRRGFRRRGHADPLARVPPRTPRPHRHLRQEAPAEEPPRRAPAEEREMKRAGLALLILAVLLAPAVLAPTTQDLAPTSETIVRGTTSGITQLLSDDGLTDTITEGGSSGPAVDNWWASSSTIGFGTLVSGTAPQAGDGNDCGDASDNGDCQYREANVGGNPDTTLDPDNDNVVTGTKTGTFPTALTTDEGTYLQIDEANTGGGGTGPPAFQATNGIIGDQTPHVDMTVTLPAHAIDDILLVMAWVRDLDDTATVTTAGWATLTGFPHDTTTGRQWLFWKRAASAAETNPLVDFSGTTGDAFGQSITFRGALATADPWTIGTWGSTGTNPLSLTSLTTPSDNNLVIAAVHYEDNDLAVAAVTGTDPAAYTEHYTESPAGADGAIEWSEAARTTAGATGAVSVDRGTLSDQTGGILLALKPIPPALWKMDYRIDWTDGAAACSDGSRVLRVSAHHSNTETILLQIDDGSDTPTWQAGISITATSDPSPTYQTVTLSSGQWDSGLPMVRFRGNDGDDSGTDATQTSVFIDDLEILCDRAAPEYTASIKWSWSGVPTTGTEWRLFVEGRRGTNPETISVGVWSASEVVLNNKVSCAISTDSATERDCGVLSADELDTGTPDMNYDDATPTDTSQSDFYVDQARIQRTYTTTTYDADVQHDWTNTVTLP